MKKIPVQKTINTHLIHNAVFPGGGLTGVAGTMGNQKHAGRSVRRLRGACACLLLAAVFILSACGEKDTSHTIAEVGGNKVTKEAFDAFLRFKRLPAADEKKRERFLEQYLDREAMAFAIEKQELLDPLLVRAELNEFRKEMLISRYFEAFLSRKVTDQAVKNYYNTHASDYEQKKYHVAHILIRTNSKMGEAERMAKLTTAREAYSKVVSGDSFKEVAERYSEDRVSGRKGGDLGWLKQGSISPEFSKTVTALAPGKVSQPFETPFGYHVVKLIEAPKVVRKPFDSVAGSIRHMLRNKAREAEMARLKTEAGIRRLNR